MKAFFLVFIMGSSVTLVGQTRTNFPILILQNGHTYSNAVLEGYTIVDAKVFVDDWNIKIPLSNCPAFLQQQCNYDPDAAGKYTETEASLRSLNTSLKTAHDQLDQAVHLQNNCSVYDDGLFDDSVKDAVRGKIIQVLGDYKILVSMDHKNGYELDDSITIVIKNYPYTGYDGADVNIMARRHGTYQYTSVLNADKTVLLYDCGTTYESPDIPKLTAQIITLQTKIAALKTSAASSTNLSTANK